MVSTIILAIQMCRHGFWGGHQRRLSNSCTERSLKQAGALALERNGRVFRSLPLDPDCLQTNLAPVTCHTQHEQFDSFVEYTIAVYLQKRFLRKGDVRPFFGRQIGRAECRERWGQYV